MSSQQLRPSILLKTLAVFFFWKISMLELAALATRWLPFIPTFTPFNSEYGRTVNYFLGIWGNFDGMHYLSVAKHGYEPLKQAFFPLYPILIAVTHAITPFSYLVSALTVSNVFLLLSLPVLYAVLKKDGQNNWFFVLSLLFLFPTSFFYGAVYNDSLFFFLATTSIFFARKKNWFAAGVAAGLATLARFNGLAIGVFLAAEYLLSDTSVIQSWSISSMIKATMKKLQLKEIWRSGALWIASVPVAFVGYLAYVQYKFGNFMALFQSMEIWKQSKFTFPPIVLWRYLKIIFSVSPNNLNYWVAAIELLAVFFYCHVLLMSIKKIRLSYWLFIFFSILIPWTTGSFQGMPRYALHIYPFFLALAILLKEQKLWIKTLYFVISIALMVVILTFFTRGHFIA